MTSPSYCAPGNQRVTTIKHCASIFQDLCFPTGCTASLSCSPFSKMCIWFFSGRDTDLQWFSKSQGSSVRGFFLNKLIAFLKNMIEIWGFNRSKFHSITLLHCTFFVIPSLVFCFSSSSIQRFYWLTCWLCSRSLIRHIHLETSMKSISLSHTVALAVMSL